MRNISITIEKEEDIYICPHCANDLTCEVSLDKHHDIHDESEDYEPRKNFVYSCYNCKGIMYAYYPEVEYLKKHKSIVTEKITLDELAELLKTETLLGFNANTADISCY